MPTLAYFSPLPPAKSGIADYSAELLPFLREQFDLLLFSEQAAAADELGERLKTAVFPAHRWQIDLPVYQMGNSALHEPHYQMLLRYPGLVVLHDYGLHHFVADRTERSGNQAAYSREVAFAQGAAGQQLIWRVRTGQAAYPLHEWPLNERVLSASLGLIVHSDYVKQKVRQQGYEQPIIVSSQPMQPSPSAAQRQALREKIGVPKEALLLASVGQITPAKQIELALRVFGRFLNTHPNAYYLLVGEPNGEVDLEQTIAELGIGERVRRVGFAADLAQFAAWIETADFILNLRHPTVGETSATALRALAAGRPVIVFDHGWYAELPDDVAVKVPLLDEAALLKAMERLAATDVRQTMGQAAVDYVTAVCHPQKIVQDYRVAYNAIMQWVQAKYG